MPPFIWKGEKTGLAHGLLQDLFSLHHLRIGMLVSGRSLRRKAIETSWHLDRLAGLRDQRDINRGSAGMLRGLAERIRDKTIIMTGGIP